MIRDTPVLRETVLRLRSLNRSVASAEHGLYTLCYHHIPAAWQARFSEQLRFLSRHGEFVDADRAADLVESGEVAEGRYFLLSFDDAYADNHDVALPVLRALKIPAILFVVSDWLDTPPAYTDRTDGYMTRADLAAWLEAELQVGSHTATHRNLGLLDRSAVAEELARSRRDLEAITGREVRHLACPWGVPGKDFDPRVDPLLAAATGYRTFHTTRRGVARGPDDLLQMPRHVLEPHWGLYQLNALMGDRASQVGR